MFPSSILPFSVLGPVGLLAPLPLPLHGYLQIFRTIILRSLAPLNPSYIRATLPSTRDRPRQPPAADVASDTSRPPVSFLAHSVTCLPKSASPAFQAVLNRKASQLRNGTEWHNFRGKPRPRVAYGLPSPAHARPGDPTRTPAGSSGLPAQHHLEEYLCGRLLVGVAALPQLR